MSPSPWGTCPMSPSQMRVLQPPSRCQMQPPAASPISLSLSSSHIRVSPTPTVSAVYLSPKGWLRAPRHSSAAQCSTCWLRAPRFTSRPRLRAPRARASRRGGRPSPRQLPQGFPWATAQSLTSRGGAGDALAVGRAREAVPARKLLLRRPAWRALVPHMSCLRVRVRAREGRCVGGWRDCL